MSEIIEITNSERILSMSEIVEPGHIKDCLEALASCDFVDFINEHSLNILAYVLNPENFQDRQDGLTHEAVLQVVFPVVNFEDEELLSKYTQVNQEIHTPKLSIEIIEAFQTSNLVVVAGPMFAQKSSASVRALMNLEQNGEEIMWSVSAALGQGYIKARDIDKETLEIINKKRIDLNDDNIDETVELIKTKIGTGKDLYLYFDEATFSSTNVMQKLKQLCYENKNFKLLISGLDRAANGQFLPEFEAILINKGNSKIIQTGAFDIFTQGDQQGVEVLSEHRAFFTGRVVKINRKTKILDLGFAHLITPDDYERIEYFACEFRHHVSGLLLDNYDSYPQILNPDEKTESMQKEVTRRLK